MFSSTSSLRRVGRSKVASSVVRQMQAASPVETQEVSSSHGADVTSDQVDTVSVDEALPLPEGVHAHVSSLEFDQTEADLESVAELDTEDILLPAPNASEIEDCRGSRGRSSACRSGGG